MSESARYVIGLGNYARNDDGIGLHVVEYLVHNDLDTDFHAVEVGNDGVKLLTYFTPATEKLVLVDCAVMGRTPGAALFFDAEQVESRKIIQGISTHEGDVIQILAMARQLGLRIPPLRIMGIEPCSLAPVMELSDTLAERLPDYARMAVEEIRRQD